MGCTHLTPAVKSRNFRFLERFGGGGAIKRGSVRLLISRLPPLPPPRVRCTSSRQPEVGRRWECAHRVGREARRRQATAEEAEAAGASPRRRRRPAADVEGPGAAGAGTEVFRGGEGCGHGGRHGPWPARRQMVEERIRWREKGRKKNK
jgi:hypothetical protein